MMTPVYVFKQLHFTCNSASMQGTLKWETFERGKSQGSVAICKSFLHKIWERIVFDMTSEQSMKVSP